MPITITPEFEAVLKTIAEGKNVFITGKAGTGKSTLLKQFIQDARNKNILVTAPTGVAALNINGVTVHKAFGFRPGQFPDDIRSKRYPSSHIVKATLKILDILVIDEVSMLRAEIFDMIDIALRKVRKTTIPFGGVQLVLVGDLLQLPPVVEDEEEKIFREQWKSPYFFDAHSYPDLHVQTIELTKIWRQSDPNFINLLDQIREGKVTNELLSQLNKCVAAPSSIGNDWTTLTARRKTADEINTKQIHNLNTKLFQSTAKITGDVDQNENNFPGSYILLYKRNARVMAVKNDPEERFVNGSFGIIQDATDKIITVKFDNGNVVRLEKHTWDIRRPAIKNGKLSTEITGSITQFPVILAWAITIHKSQGKTIPKCYINLKYGTQTEGQFYVAISRAIDLNNLRINQKVNKKNIRANNQLIRFLKYDNTGQNNTNIKRYAALSFTIIDWGFAHAQYRVAHIHCTVVNDNEIIADFGSWINPKSDIGSLAEEYNIPTFGLAAAPTIREFWPLLLRQIAGAIVIGDHLSLFERALIDQDSDLESQLGNGYDVNELPHVKVTGTTPEDRCHDIVSALNSTRSKNKPIKGEPVPSQNTTSEGVLYIPDWAPKETIQLDLTRATDTDIAWAALSSSDDSKQSITMIQNCVNSLRLKAGDYWDDRWHEEISARVRQITDGTIFIPEAVHHKVDINELIGPGTRVAFTGRISLNGQALDNDDKLKRLCEEVGLEFRNSVSKTKCDVLIARDPSLDSRKIKDARSYKKPIIPFEDFEEWYNFGLKTNILPFPSKASTLQIKFGCPDSILKPEIQVAFSGKIQVNNQHVKRASLEELCKELNLKYRQSVTQSKCDVLIVNDDNLGSNEAQKAKKYKKQFLSADDFSRWVIDHLTADSVWQHKLGLDLNVNQLEDIDSGFVALDENYELEETYNFEDYSFDDFELEEDEDYDLEDNEDYDEEGYYDLEENYDLENIDAFDHDDESDTGFDLTTEDNTQDCVTRTNLHNQFYNRLQALLTLNSQVYDCLQILLTRKTEQDIEAKTESKSGPSIHESTASFPDSLDDSDFITKTRSVDIPQNKTSGLNDESSGQMTSLAENKCEDTNRPHPTSKTDNRQRLNNKYILERTNDDSRTIPEVGAINHTPHHDKCNDFKSINESDINCSFSEDNAQHLITRTDINNQIYSYTQVLFIKKANDFNKVRSEDTPDTTTILCNSKSASDGAFDTSLNDDNTTESVAEASDPQQPNNLEEVFFGPLGPFKNLSMKNVDLESSEELFLAGKVAWVCKDELEFLNRISAGNNPFFLEREKVNRKGCTTILLLTLLATWSIVKTIIDNLSTAGYGFLGSALGAITILLLGMLLLCYLVYMFEKPPWDVTNSFEKIENIIGRPALEEFALIYVDLDSIPKIDQDILTAMQHLYANAASHETSFSPKDWRELTMNTLEAADSYHQTGNIKDAITIACRIKSIQEKLK